MNTQKLPFGSFYRAETEGFEPSRDFTPCLVSSEVLSTTQPRLQPIKRIILWAMRQGDGQYMPSARIEKGLAAGRERSAGGRDVVNYYI